MRVSGKHGMAYYGFSWLNEGKPIACEKEWVASGGTQIIC